MNSTIQLERNAFQENEEELQERRLNPPPPPPPGHEAQPHTDRFGRPPCKLVYAVLKIDFIQKQCGAQRHHLLRFPGQIITTAASTTHAASKAKESDRSIQCVGLLSDRGVGGDLFTSANPPTQPCGHDASGTNCEEQNRLRWSTRSCRFIRSWIGKLKLAETAKSWQVL